MNTENNLWCLTQGKFFEQWRFLCNSGYTYWKLNFWMSYMCTTSVSRFSFSISRYLLFTPLWSNTYFYILFFWVKFKIAVKRQWEFRSALPILLETHYFTFHFAVFQFASPITRFSVLVCLNMELDVSKGKL